MTHPHSPALRRLLLGSLLPLALGAGLAQADTYAPVPSETLLLAQHTDDTHAEGDDHGSGGKHGGGGQGQRKRLGKGAGTGEARGGHSSESDIFRDEGFDKGPPAGKGGGDDHDHEDDATSVEGEDHEDGGGPPEGRGEHEDGEEHDHEA